jgi:flagellar hook-basal body complex protein FliE
MPLIPPISPITPGVAAPTAPVQGSGAGSGSGFENALAKSLENLQSTQAQADQQVQAFATGQSQDMSSVVMSVEKASLELQLATQVRNKAVDAYNEIFRMQV